MNYYILKNLNHPPDESLLDALTELSINYELIEIPGNHTEIQQTLSQQNNGIIILPEIIVDLYSVKIIQEILELNTSFEVIMTGSSKNLPMIITAFNAGLNSYIEMPYHVENLKHIFKRAARSLNNKLSQKQAINFYSEIQFSNNKEEIRASTINNQILGQAFIDFAKKTGPIATNKVTTILLSSSPAQQNQLAKILKAIGLNVIQTENIEETLKTSQNSDSLLIISDSILPDGDIYLLTKNLQKQCQEMPKIIVWSSSPEKAKELMQPENRIDLVLNKPSPQVGVESILPAIISVIYQL